MTLKELDTRLRFKYEFEPRFNTTWQHNYIVIGPRGALNFHISDLENLNIECDRWSGGLEAHFRTPPDYMQEKAPSHDQCAILQAPCWHDGTSLYASEVLIPFWLQAPDDHVRMFELLGNEYWKRFNDGES